jgi:hypothetical protein
MITNGTEHPRWSSDCFYWSVITAPELPKGRLSPGALAHLRTLLEADLPVDSSAVHAVFARLDDSRFVACAAPRERLADRQHDPLSLCPESAPDFCGPIDPEQLNLLTGEFEPQRLKRLRTRRFNTAGLAAAACLALIAAGLWRRANEWQAQAIDSGMATREVLAAMRTHEHEDPAITQMRLRDEIAMLRRTRVSVEKPDSSDAAMALAYILAAWPADHEVRTEVVSVTPESVTMSVTVDDAPAMLRALSAPPGWVLAEPRLTQSRAGTTLSLRWTRGDAP